MNFELFYATFLTLDAESRPNIQTAKVFNSVPDQTTDSSYNTEI